MKDLTLSLECNGGAIVYLNGKEVARDRVAKAVSGGVEYSDTPGDALGKLALPLKAVRPGVNVLAIEIVRAPYRGVTQLNGVRRTRRERAIERPRLGYPEPHRTAEVTSPVRRTRRERAERVERSPVRRTRRPEPSGASVGSSPANERPRLGYPEPQQESA